jgi:hypothetical protein
LDPAEGERRKGSQREGRKGIKKKKRKKNTPVTA